jgi:HlyD family secretion protein
MRLLVFLSGAVWLALSGCSRHAAPSWQGYLEGDYVYVASPLGGQVEKLSVAKGDRVAAGAPLFTLEHSAEFAAQNQAAAELDAALARLADLRKGSRPSELASLEARLAQARAAAELSRLDLVRQDNLFQNRSVSQSDCDHARLVHEENLRAADELAADLATARLGGRSDSQAAAAGEAAAARAALAKAVWSVAQKSQAAPRAALVFDTLYREGEFAAAGSPVVSLLPPENIKVRFFVPAAEFGALRTGQAVRVSAAGRPAPLAARISYLSPQVEYTPPVLYNRDNRAKLVFMAEAVFAAADARDLHPGQPAEVTPAP